jgi:hypothetical protein
MSKRPEQFGFLAITVLLLLALAFFSILAFGPEPIINFIDTITGNGK